MIWRMDVSSTALVAAFATVVGTLVGAFSASTLAPTKRSLDRTIREANASEGERRRVKRDEALALLARREKWRDRLQLVSWALVSVGAIYTFVSLLHD